MKIIVKKLKELSLNDAKNVSGAGWGKTSGPASEKPK